MWAFMGFAGEGHRSRLGCEHTPGSGRLGCVRCPQRTLRLGLVGNWANLWKFQFSPQTKHPLKGPKVTLQRPEGNL